MPDMEERNAPVVVLGVTGGIAAYKACEVARELMRAGCRVKVVMTAAGQRFVSALTFRTLTGEPVATSLWDDEPGRVHHVSLADEADVIAVVPCTANVIAKLAQGRADDILTTTVLASEAPLVIAPAMNTHMWRKEATQESVAALRGRGAAFVEPGSGELACGDVGEGRLAAVPEIVDAVMREVARSRSLAGVRVLVTAGGTREPLDAVRFIGNRSSGRTGYAIAQEAARRGADVTLVSGPTSLPDPFGVTTVRVETALQMRDATLAAYAGADVVVAAAAVADFRPAEPQAGKIKKDAAPDAVALAPNPDILAELGRDKGRRILVGFAAETANVLENAAAKLAAKNLDLIVANDVSEPGLGFDSRKNRWWIVGADSVEALPEADKSALAGSLLDRIATKTGDR